MKTKIKSTKTPKAQIVSAIRKIWLRSRERAETLKRDNYSCVICGAKQSKAVGKEVKVCVHHKAGIDWNGIAETIIEKVLQSPELLETQCVDCHKKVHKKVVKI